MDIIVVSNEALKNRISVSLRTTGYNFNFISIKDIRKYKADLCIIVDQNDIPNLTHVIEGIVYEERFPVVYVTAKPTLLHNVDSSPIFYMLNERFIDVLLAPLCDVLTKTYKQHISMKQELEKCRHLIEDERLIAKAKLLLVEKRNMTEPEAHRYIQEEAMKARLSRSQLARRIIDEL